MEKPFIMVRFTTVRRLRVALVAGVVFAGITHAGWADTQLKILFIGNSYTYTGPVPTMVANLATSAGYPSPLVSDSMYASATLEFHTTYGPTLALVDRGAWDYVVLQEFSTRPVDNPGCAYANPTRFERDAAWFYDRIKATSPNAKIVLYETWARHENNGGFYPALFANRDVMQSQLNYWYHDVVNNYIPKHATYPLKTDVLLAPAGEVWAADYHGSNYMLFSGDLHHPNELGAHVNALTIFSVIYRRRVIDLPGTGSPQEQYLRTQVDETVGLYHTFD